MGGLGMPELLIVVLIIVILFGAKKIPELAKGMGQGIRNFKEGMRDDEPQRLEARKDAESTK
jgi:sec-independent protein translocase protein TatA